MRNGHGRDSRCTAFYQFRLLQHAQRRLHVANLPLLDTEMINIVQTYIVANFTNWFFPSNASANSTSLGSSVSKQPISLYWCKPRSWSTSRVFRYSRLMISTTEMSRGILVMHVDSRVLDDRGSAGRVCSTRAPSLFFYSSTL